MSARGRGRGAAASTGSKSTESSRSPSLTRPPSATTVTTPDASQLIKQLDAGAAKGLRLGGRGGIAPKFTPNLTAQKRKKDDADGTAAAATAAPAPSSAATATSNGPFNQRRDHSNGRGSAGSGPGGNSRGGLDRSRYIQLEGIHTGAQIPVSTHHSSFGSRGPSIKREDSPANMRTINLKQSAIRTKTLIGDVDGLKYEIDEEYEPRQIPIAERRSIFDMKNEGDIPLKSKEPTASSSEHIDSFVRLFSEQKLNQTSTNAIVKDEPMEPTDLPKNESPISDPSQLILMQFPDVLPCTRSSSSSAKPDLASLSDLPDGFLGKLQVYKSGKCRLKLNDETYLDVDIGKSTSFLQNVMVTEMASTNNTTDDMNKLVCLGDIKHKLIVSLGVEQVLEDTRQ